MKKLIFLITFILFSTSCKQADQIQSVVNQTSFKMVDYPSNQTLYLTEEDFKNELKKIIFKDKNPIDKNDFYKFFIEIVKELDELKKSNNNRLNHKYDFLEIVIKHAKLDIFNQILHIMKKNTRFLSFFSWVGLTTYSFNNQPLPLLTESIIYACNIFCIILFLEGKEIERFARSRDSIKQKQKELISILSENIKLYEMENSKINIKNEGLIRYLALKAIKKICLEKNDMDI